MTNAVNSTEYPRIEVRRGICLAAAGSVLVRSRTVSVMRSASSPPWNLPFMATVVDSRWRAPGADFGLNMAARSWLETRPTTRVDSCDAACESSAASAYER